jgi:hypothetical protein
VAVERRATKAVLGEASEVLSLTLIFLDRGRNFLASLIGGCPSERRPGAAAAPLPRQVRRHEPERTLLYRVVQTHLQPFLDEVRTQSDPGEGVPWFVEREFRMSIAAGVTREGRAPRGGARCEGVAGGSGARVQRMNKGRGRSG